MSPEEVAAGPVAAPPQLPLRIVKGKDQGATPGFQAIDAAGRKFNVKFDPRGALPRQKPVAAQRMMEKGHGGDRNGEA